MTTDLGSAGRTPARSGWLMSEHGERLHAYSVLMGRALCGLRRDSWYPPDVDAPLCHACAESYGLAFPAPPGRPHKAEVQRARAHGETIATMTGSTYAHFSPAWDTAAGTLGVRFPLAS